MEDVCNVLCYSKVFEYIVQIAVVLVRGMTALCAGDGDGGHHDVWMALGEVEKNAEKAKVSIVVCWLGAGSVSFGCGGGLGWVWAALESGFLRGGYRAKSFLSSLG